MLLPVLCPSQPGGHFLSSHSSHSLERFNHWMLWSGEVKLWWGFLLWHLNRTLTILARYCLWIVNMCAYADVTDGVLEHIRLRMSIRRLSDELLPKDLKILASHSTVSKTKKIPHMLGQLNINWCKVETQQISVGAVHLSDCCLGWILWRIAWMKSKENQHSCLYSIRLAFLCLLLYYSCSLLTEMEALRATLGNLLVFLMQAELGSVQLSSFMNSCP